MPKKKPGQPRSYTCYTCGKLITRVDSHRYNSLRYCNQCWKTYQKVWKHNINIWVKSWGEDIKSLDYFPQFKGKGYYATSNGDIYSTLYVYRTQGSDKIQSFYLPRPIKYEVKDTPMFTYSYNNSTYKMYIKDIIYTLFVSPFSKDYIIVNKDYDIFNNDVSNLIKFPRKSYLNRHIYYAVKNGRKIAESNTIAGLANILGLNKHAVGKLIRSGKKTEHGIYLKKE